MEESIQENVSASVGDEKEAIQAPPPVKKHTVKGLIKDMWPAYLIEIFVIILGISITLALEEWRDNNRENHLEQIYLKNLLTDVEVDMKSLKNVILNTQNILSHGNELLGFVRDQQGKDISSSRMDGDVRAILGRPKFFSSDATFSDLKSSGNLHLLKDIQLKNMLFAYYSQTQNIKEMQDAEQQATITLSGGYFLKRFPLADSNALTPALGQDEISNLLKNFEFDNNVRLRVLNRDELLEVYQIADSLAAQIKIELGRKIE